MARLTIRREARSGMAWIVGVVVVPLMTADTCHRCPGIYAVDMARSTRRRDMGSRQREARCTMVESRWLPRRRCVAEGTIHRERRLCVLRRNHIVIVGQVTAGTLQSETLVMPVDVALIAGHSQMCACQRKLGLAVVKR